MEHPYGEQYGQEGNPRAYMTMRDYRNLPYQWQQSVERNPSEYRSMRDYRDQWMGAPVYSVPSTYPPPPQYDHPEPPFYASTPQSPQSQQPPPLSLVEQAILNLSKQVDKFIEEQRVVTVQANQETETVESSVVQKLDGFQSRIDQKLDILQESISKLVQQFDHAEEENLEEECLIETISVEQVQLQPQEELEVELVKAPEDLQDAPVNFWPWTNEEQNTALLTEKSSGHEGTQEPIIQPNPIDLDTTATAQATKCPLPIAPSTDQVYILPSPASQPTSEAPAPKGKSNPSLHAMQNFKELVAIAQIFATTSKTMATAYIAWHSGWFGCGFGFGTPGPRHF